MRLCQITQFINAEVLKDVKGNECTQVRSNMSFQVQIWQGFYDIVSMSDLRCIKNTGESQRYSPEPCSTKPAECQVRNWSCRSPRGHLSLATRPRLKTRYLRAADARPLSSLGRRRVCTTEMWSCSFRFWPFAIGNCVLWTQDRRLRGKRAGCRPARRGDRRAGGGAHQRRPGKGPRRQLGAGVGAAHPAAVRSRRSRPAAEAGGAAGPQGKGAWLALLAVPSIVWLGVACPFTES
jgi:hypothetical protein